MPIRTPVTLALDNTGYKKKYIAEKLGINPCYLSKYLANPGDISLKNALVICELTGMSLNELDFGVPIFLGKNLN